MANMDRTTSAAGEAQLSFEPASFIDNNAWSPDEEPSKVLSPCADEPALLGGLYPQGIYQETHFLDAIYQHDLDESHSTLAYDASYLAESFDTRNDTPVETTNDTLMIPNIKTEHIKTEETKPALHLTTDCSPQPQPFMSGLTPTISNSPAYLHESPIDDTLQRTSSKRQRPNPDEKEKAKRTKKQIGGFPCQVCDKSFDRLCDMNKHYKHTHVSKNWRPYQCTECVVRFCWPKDVKRHLRQVHKMLPPTTPISPTTSRKPSIAWLTQTLVMLKKLRLRTKSGDSHDDNHPTTNMPSVPEKEKFIMVTYNDGSFQEVDVTHATDAASLIQCSIKKLGVEHLLSPETAQLSRYHRTPGFQRPLTPDALVELVSRSADSEGTLKLQLSATEASIPAANGAHSHSGHFHRHHR